MFQNGASDSFECRDSSFCLLHLVEVSALRILSVCFALMMMMYMCCENVSFDLRVIPRSLGCFVVDSV